MNESSREKLDMDLGEIRYNNRNKNKHVKSTEFMSELTFKHHKGIFVRRWVLIVTAVAVICAMLLIGLLVGFLAPCHRSRKNNNDENSSPSASECKTCHHKLFSRLPTSVMPLTYNVQLQPYIEPQLFFFDGNVPSNLEANNVYSVSMSFKGNLNNELVGFYRSNYEDANTGEQRWIAVTQFQATEARRAFPCFDEPALKATFSITLIHLKNMTALSNMPLKESEDRGTWVADKFETTVNMSTYLLAFVVGDIEQMKSNDASVNMVAVPDFNAGAMENWGLIIYRETAMLYDSNISSVFNRQRVATVVAHELAHQWFGNLVTPKWWDDLWLNEGFASYMEYEGVDSVHPNWKMFDQFVLDEIQDVFELDCLKSSHPISVKVGHPDEINEIFDRISYGKGASIIRMMNHILGSETFKKGVSNYLNALKFSNADTNDLWKYLSAAQNVNESSENYVDVAKVMDSWTLQTGYPVVTITRDYDTKTAVLSQRRFLLASRNETLNSLSDAGTKWEMPITYTNENELNWTPITKLWMRKDESNIFIDVFSRAPIDFYSYLEQDFIIFPEKDVPTADKWLIANLQEVGFYRVNYDVKNWQLLIKQLKTNHSIIHVINRAQILDDLLDLARAGMIPYSLALEATKYLKNEEEHIPWDTVASAFTFLDLMLRRTAIYGNWKRYVINLVKPVYDKIGWNVENKDDILKQNLQYTALMLACDYEHEACIQTAKTKFQEWKQSVESGKPENLIPANLRSIVYCMAVKHGSENDWNFIWSQYIQNKLAAEGDKLMRSLACSRQPWLLNRYLDWAFNESSRIRKQDGSSVFRSVAASNYGRDLAFNYLRDKWDRIVNYYGKSFFSFGNLIKSVTSSMNTEFELKQ
ncbi:aminopeptidase N-like protein, partial [Dinothrombium tinctorium]